MSTLPILACVAQDSLPLAPLGLFFVIVLAMRAITRRRPRCFTG